MASSSSAPKGKRPLDDESPIPEHYNTFVALIESDFSQSEVLATISALDIEEAFNYLRCQGGRFWDELLLTYVAGCRCRNNRCDDKPGKCQQNLRKMPASQVLNLMEAADYPVQLFQVSHQHAVVPSDWIDLEHSVEDIDDGREDDGDADEEPEPPKSKRVTFDLTEDEPEPQPKTKAAPKSKKPKTK